MTPTTALKKLLAEATKGPWKWQKLFDFNSPKFSLGPGVLLTDERDGTPWGDTIDQANARLIAMAPDLAVRVLELEAENKRLRHAVKVALNGFGRLVDFTETTDFDSEIAILERALKGGEI
jgi:hypothetical protein